MLRELLDVLRCPRSGQRLDLDVTESAGDEIAFGLLTSDAGTYPVVSGIPVFTSAGVRAVDEVRAGRGARATAEVFCAAPGGTRARRLAVAMSGSPALLGTVRLVGESLHRREVDAAAAMLSRGDLGVLDILAGAFLRGGAAMPDAHEYFRFRLGTPRHLVVLSVLEALPEPEGGLVGDFGCGAGHLTWAIAQRWPSTQVVAMDLDFRLLLAARLLVGPGPELVCADISKTPMVSSAFQKVISCDVLSYVEDKWSVVQEMERTMARDGALAITSVKDAAAKHVFAGAPLSVPAWRGLVEHLDHSVLSDDAILKNYHDGKGLPTGKPEPEPGEGQNVTIVASRQRLDLTGNWALSGWPHARGDLGLNPLYRPVGQGTYERTLPDGVYATDNPALVSYLPPSVHLDSADLTAARRGERPPAIEPLVAATAVLAYPDAYNGDRWPAPSGDASARP